MPSLINGRALRVVVHMLRELLQGPHVSRGAKESDKNYKEGCFQRIRRAVSRRETIALATASNISGVVFMQRRDLVTNRRLLVCLGGPVMVVVIRKSVLFGTRALSSHNVALPSYHQVNAFGPDDDYEEGRRDILRYPRTGKGRTGSHSRAGVFFPGWIWAELRREVAVECACVLARVWDAFKSVRVLTSEPRRGWTRNTSLHDKRTSSRRWRTGSLASGPVDDVSKFVTLSRCQRALVPRPASSTRLDVPGKSFFMLLL